MEKDFSAWHEKKLKLDFIGQPPSFSECEIWFCHLGINVGTEENGSGKEFLRPVVILKKVSRVRFFGIPLTRTVYSGNAYFHLTDSHGISVAMFDQARTLDARRLFYRSRIVPAPIFFQLKEQFIKFL